MRIEATGQTGNLALQNATHGARPDDLLMVSLWSALGLTLSALFLHVVDNAAAAHEAFSLLGLMG